MVEGGIAFPGFELRKKEQGEPHKDNENEQHKRQPIVKQIVRTNRSLKKNGGRTIVRQRSATGKRAKHADQQGASVTFVSVVSMSMDENAWTEWLESINVRTTLAHKYAKVLVDNEIDEMELLQQMTEVDLKELGMKVGTVLKILGNFEDRTRSSSQSPSHLRSASPSRSPSRSASPSRSPSYESDESADRIGSRGRHGSSRSVSPSPSRSRSSSPSRSQSPSHGRTSAVPLEDNDAYDDFYSGVQYNTLSGLYESSDESD